MNHLPRVILIVDDDENDRLFLSRALHQIAPELTTRTVESGSEAMAYLEGDGQYSDREKFPFPTLIFLDLKMPGVDGFAVLQHMKANTTWAIVPAIVFSSSSRLEDVTKAFLCGACAYHVKPQNAADREKLCRVLLDYWSMSEVPQFEAELEPLASR